MSEQNDHVTYCVLVFVRDGTEILLTRSDAGVAFPKVTIPESERVAENVTSELKRKWGEVVVCLYELESFSGTGKLQYVAARQWGTTGSACAPLQWTSVTDLTENIFSDPADFRALRESIAYCGLSNPKAELGPFASLNWFEELCEWISQSIAARRLHLTGDFRQLNASQTFSLIRFETNGPAVWFKAVGEPNQREFPITLQLSQLFPGYVAEILGTQPAWNGWLSCEADGTNLSETKDITKWIVVAEALARFQ